MKACISVVTLGVADMQRSREFYVRGLGWKESSASNEHIAFINASGLVLALYPKELLAQDAHVNSLGAGFDGITLAQNVESSAEVDAAMAAVIEAGAKLLRPAQSTFWGGYSGYFADPDGHIWEVAHNPHWGLDAMGHVSLPE
jgi:hypothetical protein